MTPPCDLAPDLPYPVPDVPPAGGLQVKILRRRAKFEPVEAASVQAVGKELKLNIPKKTKLFVDQTMRERENSQC